MTLDKAQATLQRLAKWRSHFAGWQLGTRKKDDPASQAVRCSAELMLLLRAETSAIARVLIEKGITTKEEFTITVGEEAEYLMEALENMWPGLKATDHGLSYDMKAAEPWLSKFYP